MDIITEGRKRQIKKKKKRAQISRRSLNREKPNEKTLENDVKANQ